MELVTIEAGAQDAFLHWVYLLLQQKRRWPTFSELDDALYRQGRVSDAYQVWANMPAGLVRPTARASEAAAGTIPVGLTVAGAEWVLRQHGRTLAADRFLTGFLGCIERALDLDRAAPGTPLSSGDGIEALGGSGAYVDELRLLGHVLAGEPLGFTTSSLSTDGVAEWSLTPGRGIRKFRGVLEGTIHDLASYWAVRQQVLNPTSIPDTGPPSIVELGTGSSGPPEHNDYKPAISQTTTTDGTEEEIMRPQIFIGSSTLGLTIANHLAIALEQQCNCDATVWHEGVFELSGSTLTSLEKAAKQYDFAVLVATADDTLTTDKGDTSSAVRDNVVFELGLFIGALGSERVYIVAEQVEQQDPGKNLRLPTDLAGVTWAPYRARSDGKLAPAVGRPATIISGQVEALGPRRRTGLPGATTGGSDPPDALTAMFGTAIEQLRANAEAQGWIVKQNATTLRLRHRKKKHLKFALSTTTRDGTASEDRLQILIRHLIGAGIRINQSIISA